MTVLVIAPHPDDEVIGVGGTIAKRVKDGDKVVVCICTKGIHRMFSPEIINVGRVEARCASTYLGVRETIFLDLPAAELDRVPLTEIISRLEKVIEQTAPDDFIPIWEKELKRNICRDVDKRFEVTEKLFVHQSRIKDVTR